MSAENVIIREIKPKKPWHGPDNIREYFTPIDEELLVPFGRRVINNLVLGAIRGDGGIFVRDEAQPTTGLTRSEMTATLVGLNIPDDVARVIVQHLQRGNYVSTASAFINGLLVAVVEWKNRPSGHQVPEAIHFGRRSRASISLENGNVNGVG